MERQQLKLGDKVKMKLVQPAIICSGRKEVTCYYKGTVINVDSSGKDRFVQIEFKRYGEVVDDIYDCRLETFVHDDYKDIRIQYPKVCCFD